MDPPVTEDADDAQRSAYTAVLSSTAACEFQLVAHWPHHVHVALVIGQWYFNGTPPAPNGTEVFTTQAPGTGPNAGTIEHHTATFTAGPLYPSSVTYPWYAVVQYYDEAGAQLASVYSNVDTTACASEPGL